MKKITKLLLLAIILTTTLTVALPGRVHAVVDPGGSSPAPTLPGGPLPTGTTQVNAACKQGNFLGIFPPWYKYLDFNQDCTIKLDLGSNPQQFWLVAFGIIDILLRAGGLVAVIMVVVGGVRLATSQGEPDKVKGARNTIINALIGVSITVLASALVGFFVEQFK